MLDIRPLTSISVNSPWKKREATASQAFASDFVKEWLSTNVYPLDQTHRQIDVPRAYLEQLMPEALEEFGVNAEYIATFSNETQSILNLI